VDSFTAKCKGHLLAADLWLDSQDVNLIGQPFKYNHDAIESIWMFDETAIKAMHDG